MENSADSKSHIIREEIVKEEPRIIDIYGDSKYKSHPMKSLAAFF